jgi:hypothetical protein
MIRAGVVAAVASVAALAVVFWRNTYHAPAIFSAVPDEDDVQWDVYLYSLLRG